MQPPDDVSPMDPPSPLPIAASTVRLPKKRPSVESLALSDASLSYRRTKPLAASLFASTLTPPGSTSVSRSSSPGPQSMSSRTISTGSIFGAGGFQSSLLDTGAAENPGDPLNLILKSFVPHVAVYGSPDVDDLVREKGLDGGLWALLRPFGERVQGKVTVRDSNGASRSWEDFAVHFTRFGEGVEEPNPSAGLSRPTSPPPQPNGSPDGFLGPGRASGLLGRVEQLVTHHLDFAEDAYLGSSATTPTKQGLDVDATSPYYALYLRRLLSGLPLSAHETFAHPVACVIAISSRNPTPIEAFRRLYTETSQGERRLPTWVAGDYLRYYVLVHDEEKGDISKSMALFDQMKRNLGLHCHLLRIRSSQSAETDDDSIPLPRSDWMTAQEELEDIEKSNNQEDMQHMTRYVYESDATAIRTFIREMVTQSIVPTMERHVTVWNDQVASRRRGIAGRFMSLSKRFTFSSGSKANNPAGPGNVGSTSSNNYDAMGFYRPGSPEAIMRKLADFAFMLRDWKLAMSTYELLRSDFQNDKAWWYHAAANEMAALALLIMPQNMSSKTRIDTISQMLEQAFYSYQTRCSSSYGAVRCVVLALELLRLRSGAGVDEAVKWGIRLLESRLVGPVGDALLRERMAVCYASKSGVGSQAWGSRRRKSALWSVLGAEAWAEQAKYVQAQRCLNEAERMHSLLPAGNGVRMFAAANDLVMGLNAQLKERWAYAGIGARDSVYDSSSSTPRGRQAQAKGRDAAREDRHIEEESEDLQTNGTRSRGASFLISVSPVAGTAALQTAPLAPLTPAKISSYGDVFGSPGSALGDGFG